MIQVLIQLCDGGVLILEVLRGFNIIWCELAESLEGAPKGRIEVKCLRIVLDGFFGLALLLLSMG